MLLDRFTLNLRYVLGNDSTALTRFVFCFSMYPYDGCHLIGNLLALWARYTKTMLHNESDDTSFFPI